MVPQSAREEREAAAELLLTTRSGPTLALLAFGLLVGGVLVRLPVLYLPLEGDGALLATRALGDIDVDSVAHRGPLLPLLLRLPILFGATPTAALRALDVLCGAAIAPLVLLLGLRLGLSGRRAALTGLLLVLHPILLAFAGGPVAGTSALLTVMLLAAVLLLGARARRARGAGVVAAALAPLADPYGLAWMPFFAYEALRREPTPRARALVGGVFLAVLLVAPVPLWMRSTSWGARLAGGVLMGATAALIVLWPGVPAGVRTGLARGGLMRAALSGAALLAILLVVLPLDRTFGLSLDAGSAAVPLVPLLLLAGIVGLGAAVRRRALMAVGVGCVLSALVVVGPLQVFLRPEHPAAAGQLDRLRRALGDVERAAGTDGWIAFDAGTDLSVAESARLADLVSPGHRIGRLPRLGGDDPLDAVFPVLPLHELPEGVAVGVLTRYRPVILPVGTGGGQGIFEQVPVARRGPWLVLRLQRP